MRESEEEIGLTRNLVEVLGTLDDFTTWDDRVAVTPVAGRIASLPDLSPRSAEVARIFEIEVSDLSQPERWTCRPDPIRGGDRRLYTFEHDGETLWGLSARIVIHVLELMSLPSPRPDRR